LDLITLKQTDLRVSRIVFGTMTFGSQVTEPVAIRMVEQCLDAGVNFFDTANVYNGGTAEVFTGRALKGKRHRVVIATKVRGRMGDAPDQSGLTKAAMVRACEESLKRLDTDYIDLYYLHQPDPAAPIEETLEAMHQLERDGKVRHPACSNYAAWQMVEMLWIARRRGFKPMAISQPMYNLLARGIEQEYLAMTQRFEISNIVYNPLAGGLLTGKQPSDHPLAGSRFDSNQLYLGRYWHNDTFRAVEQLKPVAAREGRSLVSLSLNWLLHHTLIECVILGASHPQQLTDNLKAIEDGPLTSETMKACDAVWEELRGVTPKYNR
jgi:1-deoxyxylulose-5-phosphate synthase